jgi:hypothetical protein
MQKYFMEFNYFYPKVLTWTRQTYNLQYLVYGCCHMAVALIFILCVSYRACFSLFRRRPVIPVNKMNIYAVESMKSIDSGSSD